MKAVTDCSIETDGTEENRGDVLEHPDRTSEEEVYFSRECVTSLAQKTCSKECIHNPVILNVVLCIIFGIPAVILFSIYPQHILQFIIDHATLIQVLGPFVRILSRIFYALAFIPLGTLYKFAIGVLDIESNWVVGLIYEAISTVCEIIAFKYHRVYGKLPDIEELQSFKKKLEQFRNTLDDGESVKSGNNEKLIDDRTLSTVRKLLEIYMIQNAMGVPDTLTTIYFATATNWSVYIFAASTFASNFTIGLIKVTAWVVALRQVQYTIEQNPDGRLSAWDLLLGLDDDLSTGETILVLSVSVIGFLFCLYRASRFFWLCCLRPRVKKWRQSHLKIKAFDMEKSTSREDSVELANAI